jgi:alkaline phosphatase D
MLDTRIEGRDRQYAYYGSVDADTSGNVLDASGNPAYQYQDYLTGIKGSDGSRNLISTTQYNWLVNGIRDSSATWQLVGNQDPCMRYATPKDISSIGPNAFFKVGAAVYGAAAVAVMVAYALPPALRNPAQQLLTDASLNPYLPLNLDAWDGYPLQRDRLFRDVNALGKKMTFLTGDIHNAFFSRLKTLDGTIQVGYEIITPSISAPGYEAQGAGDLAGLLDGTTLGYNPLTAPSFPTAKNYGNGLGMTPDIDYANLKLPGWTKVTVTSSNIQAQHIYMSTVSSPVYTEMTGPLMTLDKSYNRTFDPPFGNPV